VFIKALNVFKDKTQKMQPAELKLFFKKFALGTNTEEEHQQFMEWLETAPIEDVKVVLEQYNINLHDDGLLAGEIDSNLVSQIEAALDQYESDKESRYFKSKKNKYRYFLNVAAAACLIIFISAGAIYFTSRNTKNNTIAEVPHGQIKDRITPGENKAILTLADGSTIILDETKNGQVAQQGGTQITKLTNGQLVYNRSNSEPAKIAFNSLTTPRGGQFKLTLPDGSEAWLNAASSIKYPTAFAGHERKVEISGEVYFEIAHNASKPFKVSVNGIEVKVLGTHFNINAYSDEVSVKTTLLEGSIKLAKGGSVIKLAPGQQAQVRNGSDIKVINNVDVNQVVAWKSGYFSFNRADIQTVMRQIARWYDVEVSYEKNIPERQFGGKIDRNSNITEVLKILAESKVHFRIDGKKIIVSP
jgi:ferric-dicitrate binding protein FerR (iron transport regulator)